MATENPNIQDIVGKMAALKAELAKVIVGQQDVIDQIIITLLAGGHALLTGVASARHCSSKPSPSSSRCRSIASSSRRT